MNILCKKLKEEFAVWSRNVALSIFDLDFWFQSYIGDT